MIFIFRAFIIYLYILKQWGTNTTRMVARPT